MKSDAFRVTHTIASFRGLFERFVSIADNESEQTFFSAVSGATMLRSLFVIV